jgi:hypothetical protein
VLSPLLVRRLAPLCLLAPLALAACAEDDDVTTGDDAYLKNVEKTGGKSQKWIYEGALPKLDTPSIVVSLKAHTLRMTGLLPQTYEGELPFYAKTSTETNGRTRVTVVYPVATGAIDPSTGKAPAGPGHYNKLFGVPFTPTTDKAAWGGFPFLKYHMSRGLAFHGPITSAKNADTGDWEWILKRGPVSHGCQRMQGEHVVELSHMLGMNMAGPHKSGDTSTINISVDVTNEYDTFEGKLVDVDYPALASVKRPTGNVVMFDTWDSRNIPNLVCAYDSTRLLDGTHCDNVGVIKQDVLTGEMLVVEEPETKWIGTACKANSDCNFKVDGDQASCNLDDGDGYCTVACAGYCDDAPGAAPTFCGRTGNNSGTCMAKAAPENDGCESIPGTSPKTVERFVGSSGAAAKVATVCSF